MTSTTHHRIALAGLVLGPLSFAIADLLRRVVEPSSSVADGKLVTAIADRPGLWLLAGLLSALSAFLLIPGVAAVLGRAHGRGATLTMIGGYVFGAGVLASIGHMSEYFGTYGTYEKAGIGTSTIQRLGSASYLPNNLFIAVFLVGMFVGLILMMLGLRRAGAVPIWAVVAAIIAIVVGSSGGVAAGAVGVVAWLATFLPIARWVSSTPPPVNGTLA